jgi:DNA-directed RNA polymerase specialized sigma24 family protein
MDTAPGLVVGTMKMTMTEPMDDWLVRRFEAQRPQLRALAYRMLGSLAEADDAVQDAWLRVSRADVNNVENVAGWLTTIVARVCLNSLRARRTRHEEPLDERLPDPVVSLGAESEPEQQAQRLAFVLYDVFELPHVRRRAR